MSIFFNFFDLCFLFFLFFFSCIIDIFLLFFFCVLNSKNLCQFLLVFWYFFLSILPFHFIFKFFMYISFLLHATRGLFACFWFCFYSFFFCFFRLVGIFFSNIFNWWQLQFFFMVVLSIFSFPFFFFLIVSLIFGSFSLYSTFFFFFLLLATSTIILYIFLSFPSLPNLPLLATSIINNTSPTLPLPAANINGWFSHFCSTCISYDITSRIPLTYFQWKHSFPLLPWNCCAWCSIFQDFSLANYPSNVLILIIIPEIQPFTSSILPSFFFFNFFTLA